MLCLPEYNPKGKQLTEIAAGEYNSDFWENIPHQTSKDIAMACIFFLIRFYFYRIKII